MFGNQIKFSLNVINFDFQSWNFRLSMKIFVKVLLIISAFVSSECRTMSWGSLQPRNLILFDQFFREPPGVEIKDFEFSTKHGSVITAIHITDLTVKQNGGCVKITCGGIGHTFVKIQLIPVCNLQLLMNIEIFGS